MTNPPQSRQPRYMAAFVAKVEEEERQKLEGWYEGEVVQRSKTYAWVRPLDVSQIPEEVLPKLQAMNDGFRKKASEGDRRPFCGGLEDNKGVGAYEVIPE